MKTTIPTKPIDVRQREMLDDLQGITFLPGSFDKRFCRNVGSQTVITERQAALLEQMYHRYRKQIAGHKHNCRICSGQIEYSRSRRKLQEDISLYESAKLERWYESVKESEREPEKPQAGESDKSVV